MKTDKELFEIVEHIYNTSSSYNDFLEKTKAIRMSADLELDEDDAENIIFEPSTKPNRGTITLTEDQIIAQMQDFLTECDADELARLTGEIFGGECYFLGGEYRFYPDKDNYFGAFDKEKQNG